LRIEGALRSAVWAELPAYRLADGATDALVWTLDQVRVEGDREAPTPDFQRKRALLYLGVIALRETRAILALTACGYEAETTPHTRTLMEALGRATSVENDPSGTYAKAWLKGRGGSPSREFSKQEAEELWKLMSHSSHADARGVEYMYATADEEGATKLLMMPERRPDVSTAILSMAAGHVRDTAQIIATAFDITIPNLARLDAAIKQFPLYAKSAERTD
jgi:hypothetical protein